jgi:hypothetical protein
MRGVGAVGSGAPQRGDTHFGGQRGGRLTREACPWRHRRGVGARQRKAGRAVGETTTGGTQNGEE